MTRNIVVFLVVLRRERVAWGATANAPWGFQFKAAGLAVTYGHATPTINPLSRY